MKKVPLTLTGEAGSQIAAAFRKRQKTLLVDVLLDPFKILLT